MSHLAAHLFNYFRIERYCVIYGTWLYYTGWLLTVFLFSESIAQNFLSNISFCLFWLLMMDRRHAWGIIIWEFLSQLDQNSSSTQKSQTNSRLLSDIHVLSFRIWCIFGTGCFWGLMNFLLVYKDGFSIKYILQVGHIVKLLWISIFSGLNMIVFWSFWTFQYKGIMWQKELRKGIVVWYSEGIGHAAQVL